MPTVLRTSAARNDLLEIGRFIASDSLSLKRALDFLDKIDAKCEQYATQPLMATARPDLGDQVRTFSVDNHVVIYQPIDNGIRVLMVVHSSRDIPPLLNRRTNEPTK